MNLVFARGVAALGLMIVTTTVSAQSYSSSLWNQPSEMRRYSFNGANAQAERQTADQRQSGVYGQSSSLQTTPIQNAQRFEQPSRGSLRAWQVSQETILPPSPTYNDRELLNIPQEQRAGPSVMESQKSYVNPFDDALTGAWNSGDCGDCGLGSCSVCSGAWFGGARVFFMNRAYESDVLLQTASSSPDSHPLTSTGADLGGFVGGEVTFGRQTRHGWSWAVTYFGAQDDGVGYSDGYDSVSAFSTTTNVFFGPESVNWLRMASSVRRVTRENEFNNVELNFYFPVSCNFKLISGLRYFRFSELFQFASAYDGVLDRSINDIYYDIDVENTLIGWQFGGTGERAITQRLSLTGTTKLGIYNNYVKHRQRIYDYLTGNASVGTGTFAGQEYDVSSSSNNVAFVSEVDLGLAYRVMDNWRLTAGYRVMVATGIALAPGQIPGDFSDLARVAYINTGDNLILHGAYLGAEFLY